MFCLIKFIYNQMYSEEIKEILASELCRKTAKNLMEDFKKINEPWKICTEEGGLIQNFGEEAGKIYKELTDIFDIETKLFKNSKSYLSYRAVFSENLMFLLGEIYEKLVSKLKEFSFQSFREAISESRASGAGRSHAGRVPRGRVQPTDPSISRSMRRFSSTEYSIGNWRARSLMKPFTARLMAWPSVSPRCCM